MAGKIKNLSALVFCLLASLNGCYINRGDVTRGARRVGEVRKEEEIPYMDIKQKGERVIIEVRVYDPDKIKRCELKVDGEEIASFIREGMERTEVNSSISFDEDYINKLVGNEKPYRIFTLDILDAKGNPKHLKRIIFLSERGIMSYS